MALNVSTPGCERTTRPRSSHCAFARVGEVSSPITELLVPNWDTA